MGSGFAQMPVGSVAVFGGVGRFKKQQLKPPVLCKSGKSQIGGSGDRLEPNRWFRRIGGGSCLRVISDVDAPGAGQPRCPQHLPEKPGRPPGRWGPEGLGGRQPPKGSSATCVCEINVYDICVLVNF